MLSDSHLEKGWDKMELQPWKIPLHWNGKGGKRVSAAGVGPGGAPVPPAPPGPPPARQGRPSGFGDGNLIQGVFSCLYLNCNS